MPSMLVANPKMKGAAKKAAPTAYKNRPGYGRKKSRRTRRNPIGTLTARRPGAGMKSIVPMLTSSGVGALGGLALDMAMKPMPLSFKTGTMGHLVRAGLAIGVGVMGGKNQMIGHLANGALTIAMYQLARERVAVPMGLAEISDADMAAIETMGSTEYLESSGVGEYDVGLGDYDTVGDYSDVYETR